jgi:FKBP-type peptidyl-prolyl cis-trans isomerase FkpA
MTRFLFIASLLFVLASCKTYSDQELKGFDKEIQAFMKKNKLDLDASPSGLYFKITKEGEGRMIQYTDSVSISYKGKLLNGRIFDYTKVPLTFAVKGLIAGWKEALLSCKKGSEVIMIIPPQLGYGNHKLDDIPQNSILFFEMKVWNVK